VAERKRNKKRIKKLKKKKKKKNSANINPQGVSNNANKLNGMKWPP